MWRSTSFQMSGSTLSSTGVQFDTIDETLQVETDSESYLYHVLEFLFQADLPTVLKDIIPDQPKNRLYKPDIPLALAVLRTFLGDKDALRTRLTSDPIDIRSDAFEPIAAAFLFIVGREQLLMERKGGPRAFPLPDSLSAPPQTVKEIFLLERSVRYSYVDILDAMSMKRLDSDAGKDDIDLIDKLTPFSRHAKPFRTARGYIGFGRTAISKGDLVCVLASSGTPVILRRVDDHYVLVSICFILGCMQGEVWPIVDCGELNVQQFNIC